MASASSRVVPARCAQVSWPMLRALPTTGLQLLPLHTLGNSEAQAIACTEPGTSNNAAARRLICTNVASSRAFGFGMSISFQEINQMRESCTESVSDTNS